MRRIPQKDILSALDSSHDGFLISSPQGIALYFNRPYVKLTRLEGILEVGSDLWELHRRGLVPSASCLEAVQTQAPVNRIHYTAQNRTAIITASIPCFDDTGRLDRVVTNVRDVSEFFDLREQIESVQSNLERFSAQVGGEEKGPRSGVIAVSPVMQSLLETAEHIAAVDAGVLIQGESGTGKEVLAHFIHASSPRRDKPFLAINCGAIPESLLESELFGYTEGVFTGQVKGGKKGIIRAAEGGTLLLDEIGDMPLSLQGKLLRFLDSKTYLPLGATQSVSADVRIVSATSRDLQQMVREGAFRPDLYYRLNIVDLRVPPLRERRDDIGPLAMFFLDQGNRSYHLQKRMPSFVLQALHQYDWPGNVRELRNVVERMVVLSHGQYCELPPGFSQDAHALTDVIYDGDIGPLSDYLAQKEQKYIMAAYRQCGTTRKAAQALGIDHSTLIRKMRRYGISAIDRRKK